jgi:trk system potassium uptake protein TrkA
VGIADSCRVARVVISRLKQIIREVCFNISIVEVNSILAGYKLRELELAAKIGVDIIAIRRKGEWIINPEGDETIDKDDVLIARGAPLGVEELKGLAGGAIQEFED